MSNERLEQGITVALLAYHEAENLRVLLPEIISRIDTLGQPYTIEVVDTAHPTDDTEAVCREYGAEYHPQESEGFGGAMRTAIAYAKREIFLILDSDGSHSPEYIPAMYGKFKDEQLDLVIGSRYVEGGKSNDARSSYIMSQMLNLAFRIVIGLNVCDLSTNYRMYDTAQLKAVSLECVNYDVLEEVLLKLKLQKPDFSVGEVPIIFNKRMYGESKRRLIPFIISYIKTLFRLLFMRVTAIKSHNSQMGG